MPGDRGAGRPSSLRGTGVPFAGSATKAALRRSALRARRDLSLDERRAASAAAVARLRALPDLAEARTVALYAAMADELDPAGLLDTLRSRGVRTLFPRMRGEVCELAAADGLSALEPGHRGVREPVGPAIDPDVVDAVVAPGVAFDLAGGCLGHGGGHYDRLLTALPDRCVRIGSCFACQLVPRVPRESHDVTVDVVVTERAGYRTHARGESHGDRGGP